MRSNKLNLLFFLFSSFFLLMNSYSQENIITLKSLPDGSEGNSKFTDSSEILINSSGLAVYNNSNQFDDWSVTSSLITPNGASNKTFDVLLGGMATVNTKEGKDYGKKLTSGGLDRDNNGAIGVRGGDGGGMGINEGVYFGLDLSQMDASVGVQITKVYVKFSGSVSERGVIVSKLNTSKRITFGNTPGVDVLIDNEENGIDISSFNVYITDSSIDDSLISIFNTSLSANNIRVTGIDLKILDNNLDISKVSNLAHPRLLLKQGEESKIHKLIGESLAFKGVHDYIIAKADDYLNSPQLVKPNTDRILAFSREVIFQIFYTSYAYRMTNDSKYLTKGEEILNTVSDFNNWHNYTLDTAGLCFGVAIGYDWLYNNLSEATKQKVRNSILNYALLSEKNKGFWEQTSNWNQVGIGGFGLGAIAIVGDGTSQMDTEASYYLNKILVENPKSMNTYANGNYQEGAMYWSYGTTYEVMLLSTLEGIYGTNHEGINRLTYTPGFLESAEFMQYITGPTSLYFNYMDSTEKRTPLPATFWMAKKLDNPSLLVEEEKLVKNGSYFTTNIAETRFLPITLIYAKDISLKNLSAPQSKLWKGYGSQPVAIVRTNWEGATGKYLGLKAGTPNYSHGQMDGGTFVYDSQGMRWATDFGKFDYAASNNYLENLNPPLSVSDFSQNSGRWDIFRVNNISHNTISIKKTTESSWQKHKVSGVATLDEVYDTQAKRGGKLNLKSILGLNNELNSIYRTIALINDDFLEIKDEIKNGNTAIDFYWNMATTAVVNQINSNTIKLEQGGKTVLLEITSSNNNVNFTIATNRSTDPEFYNLAASHERKNDNAVMVGFTSTIPANANVDFTITLKDDEEVEASTTVSNNEILLELPNPNTGLEGNSLYRDQSNFYINEQGSVSISGISSQYAWKVYGDTNITEALKSSFTFIWDGMGTTNTTAGNNYGALLTQSGIDRASNGDLGVRGGDAGGIDPNEGFRVGLDLKELPTTVSLQLTKVGLDFIGGNEKGEIVNRNDTSKKISFGAPGVAADVNLTKGFIDVESLNIIAKGGETNFDVASIFSTSSSGAFRITKFVFKVIESSNLSGFPENKIYLVPTANGTEGNSLFQDESILKIDASGIISYVSDGATNNDWIIDATTDDVTLLGAQSTIFKINWKGIGTVNTNEGVNLGALITQGGIDRASNGELGIRTGSGNGIEPQEGFMFGFDLSGLSKTVTLQITGISFSGITVSNGEEVTLVNRLNTSKKLITQSNTINDVSELNLYVNGGTLESDLLSVFHSGNPTGFRINGVEFKILNSTDIETIWSGNSNSDWTKQQNWSKDFVPVISSNVLIPKDLVNYPELQGDISLNTLTIASGASVVTKNLNSFTGDVTYQREIKAQVGNSNGWHLIAAPLKNQAYNNAFANTNNLATSGSKRGLSLYNTNGSWSYLENDDSNAGIFEPGKGYSIKVSTTGNVNFKGALNIENSGVSNTVNTSGNGFNLLGNPYTSYVNSGTFLNDNENLDAQIWLWNPTTSNYEVKIAGENFKLSPAQGFFVKANSGTAVNFAESNQTTGSDTFQKSAITEIKLLMNDGTNNRFAKIYYTDIATKGFDAGWEGETFEGLKNKADVFSQLVTNNQGKNYQIQSLPKSKMESTIVPIGIRASVGKEITFSSETLNLPSGLKVFLEDKETGITTRLDESNSEYKVTLNSNLDDVGRFYLYARSTALSTSDVSLENVSIYSLNNSILRILGLSNGKSSLKLYNTLGKQILNTSFNSRGMHDINLPKLSAGIYIIQLENEKGMLNKKIIIE